MQVTGGRGSVVISVTLKQNAPGVEIYSRCRRENLRKPSIQAMGEKEERKYSKICSWSINTKQKQQVRRKILA